MAHHSNASLRQELSHRFFPGRSAARGLGLAMLVLAIVASGSAQNPAPQTRTLPVEDLVNIDFRNDLRLFTVMCALNAAGFEAESAASETSDPRAALQEWFRRLPDSTLAPLRTYLREHASSDPSKTQAAFTSLALTLGGPPEFEPALPVDQLPEDARSVVGFAELLGPFWEQAQVARLWDIYQPRYIQELERYRPVVRDMIRETLGYFRVPARIVLDRQILLIPDLLNMKGVVNARNLDRTYTILVGPVDNPASNRRQLEHEYLHFLVDPLVDKFGARALENRDLLAIAHEQPQLRPDHRDRFLLIVTESLIEAIQLRLDEPAAEDFRQVDPVRRGLIFLPHFLRQLRAYEASEASLPERIAPMFEAISKSDTRADVARIADLEAGMAERRQQAETERAAVEESNRRAELFNQAGRLMESGDLEAARSSLETLLQTAPEDGEVHFYLGQIASRQQRHDEAFGHYSTAAEGAVRSDVRAWSLLRMGLYLAARGDFDQARVRFQEVLALDGELGGARREAESRLRQLPLPTPPGNTDAPPSVFNSPTIMGQ